LLTSHKYEIKVEQSAAVHKTNTTVKHTGALLVMLIDWPQSSNFLFTCKMFQKLNNP